MPGLVIVNVPPCTSSGTQLLGARAGGQVVDRAAQAEQVLLVGVADHRHDQAVLERDRNPEIDVLLVDDVVAVDRRVDDRELAKRVDDRLGDEGREGQLRAGALRTPPCCFSRSALTRPKFTSYTEYTCGEVCALSTMCSAIFLRITLIGTICTFSPG